MTTDANRRVLIEVARQAIRHGLETGRPLRVDPVGYPAELQAASATFVTLQTGGRLRGCIGHLAAHQPLVADVAENAFAAAFRDPRFPPLTDGEWPDIDVHISVLTPPERLEVGTEQQLLDALEPGRDGLIIADAGRRATFLPSVWESLPNKIEFLRHLKQKAGLEANYWSPTLAAFRYETENFAD